ncbi:MAG: hypothetical protein Q4B28_04645 [bacterium]|nr:hypothetical protein [bacterium]
MTPTLITLEQAQHLIQEAQNEVLTHYDDFLDNLKTAATTEANTIIEQVEKNSADNILDNID